MSAKVASLVSNESTDTLSQRKALIETKINLQKARNRFLWSSVLSMPVVAIGMAMPRAPWLHGLQFLLTQPVCFAVGNFLLKLGVWQGNELPNGSLIALGVGAAYGIACLVLLKVVGICTLKRRRRSLLLYCWGVIWRRGKGQAGAAIRKLVDLQPQTATVIRDGVGLLLDVDAVVIGTITVNLLPGERIPTDGVVIAGVSTVDESMVTGESLPVVKEVNHVVIGASTAMACCK